MLCQACKERTATIHLTEITNGQRAETHLCQECAHQQGLAVKAQIPLNELLSTLLSVQPQAGGKPKIEDKECPECGMTLKRFSKESLLGCGNDYKAFEKELNPLIERNHNGATCHTGKTPSQTCQQDKTEIALRTLRRELDAAVKNEDYETAARLRDRMKQYQ
jgi:protein arginine kinase activator